MTTPVVVQHATVHKDTGGPWASGTITFSAATAGNTILIVATCAPTGFNGNHLHEPSGYTRLCGHNESSDDSSIIVARKVAAGGETSATVTVFHNPNTSDDSTSATATRIAIWMVEVDGDFGGYALNTSSGSPFSMPSIAPTAGADALIVAFGMNGNAYGISTHPTGYTLIDEVVANTGASERLAGYSRIASPASGSSYGGNWTYAGGVVRFKSVQVWFAAFPEITLEADADPATGDSPLAVDFTATVTGGTASAFSWDFGDGSSSSSQNPSHTYTDPGTYTATVTATIDGDDYTDSVTINVTTDVGFVDPPPGLALLEIYVNEPGSARWDVALWDEAVWSTAGWQNVTPLGVQVQILWGSHRPEMGILATPDAESWAVDFYDPERILDPANESSTYWGDILPALPIRITHNGFVVKTAQAESIGHNFADDTSYIRATDAQSQAGNAMVPDDTALADTLYARARDAIAAAGLSIEVLPDPAGGDPAVAAWASGTSQSAWAWIVDAADQVLWMPYVDRFNRIGFRPYDEFTRGRGVDATNLVGLSSVIYVNGVYNVVTVLDDDGVTVVTREVTPKPPEYGARTYDARSQTPTIDAATWAETVLSDRANAGLQWLPGDIAAFSAADVRYFASMEPGETIGVSHDYTTPPVNIAGVIVGGSILVEPKSESEAYWTFSLDIAQVPLTPLVSDEDGISYLVRDDDPASYLYPDV